jgi:putative aminopeptidase FrvX
MPVRRSQAFRQFFSKATRYFDRKLLAPLGIFALLTFSAPNAFAQRSGKTPASASLDLGSELRELVDTPSVSGYEHALAEQIRAQIASYHPVIDNLGDVIVTIGSGAPHRLLVAPIDEPGLVVSDITPDGYLRVQRLPQSGLPPIFNALYAAQPVKVETTSGKWINGVVAGTSIHLHSADDSEAYLSNLDNMYIDVGATSAAEVRAAGVDLLSPVVVDGGFVKLGAGPTPRETTIAIGQPQNLMVAGRGIGDKFGAAILATVLSEIDPAKVEGTLTVAFVAQQRTGARGLQRILRSGHFDEMIYVGRLLPGGPIRGMKEINRAPRREPGSGVLLGLAQTTGVLSGFPAQLQQLAATHKIPFATDYSATIIPRSYIASPSLPAKWAHLGIAIAWPDTPIETLSWADVEQLTKLLEIYTSGRHSNQDIAAALAGNIDVLTHAQSKTPSITTLLSNLTETYGASNHEAPIREEVKSLLPKWAKAETDGAGNLILHLGNAPADSKSPKLLVVAHLDEIGFQVKSISDDGLLDVVPLGGMDLNYYEGHPVLVHTATSDRWGLLELPNGWDRPDFHWPADSDLALRVDVGARNPAEVAKLGIKVGDSITIPKKYRPLLGTRATARSLDDRVGDAALIFAVWSLGPSLANHDVTFVWSTGEELGLDGAQALAKRLAAEDRTPDYVFAIDTFVSSDSPLESKRYADAELGKGFVVRAVDNSNIVPRDLVERVVKLAHENRIPVQYGVTGGGNDGAAFVSYGAVDVALGWPLRYSHSPAEEIDTRDADALARIVAAIANSW